ncbi:MAG: hypothetical protein HOV94_19920 [Saccharothrix sp.]|nr:hypothetical protein [Saccharothrix sp.]
MRDWEQFVRHVPWFVEPRDVIVVGEEVPWPRPVLGPLPRLSALLSTASLTPVSVSGTRYEVIAWGPAGERRGWLCHPPVTDRVDVHPVHRLFWSVCGGVVERFGEPTGRWTNQDDVLTARAAETRVSDVLLDYRWLWDDAGLDLPTDLDDHYAVAVEANGNLTLAHRRTGELLLFAPDHSFDGVTPRAGCPPYSLLTVDDLPDLPSWIERCAGDWSV